jgi:hypothetical protein
MVVPVVATVLTRATAVEDFTEVVVVVALTTQATLDHHKVAMVL